MNYIKQSLSILFLFIAISTNAYDAVGHRIVADIAYYNLAPKAKKQADKVLGKHGIIYAATWADEVRSDNKYSHTYQWHYQNLNDNLSVTDLEKLLNNPTMEGEHLFYAIDLLCKRLEKNKNDEEALKLLVHFVGDLHQPMHLGRLADKGGNDIKTNWFGKTINLHSLWDSYIIEAKRMSYSEYSIFLQDKFESRKSELKKCNLLQSVEAGYTLRSKIYSYDNSDTNNYHYIYYFDKMQDEMLFRGGIQLANILNRLYN